MNELNICERTNKQVNERVYSFLETIFFPKRNGAISKDLGYVALQELIKKMMFNILVNG